MSAATAPSVAFKTAFETAGGTARRRGWGGRHGRSPLLPQLGAVQQPGIVGIRLVDNDGALTPFDTWDPSVGRLNPDLLTALQRAIRVGDGQQLFDHFTRTRAIRRSIIEQGQDDDRPDFGRSDHG